MIDQQEETPNIQQVNKWAVGYLVQKPGSVSNSGVQYMSAALLDPVVEEWWEIGDLLARLTGGLSQ